MNLEMPSPAEAGSLRTILLIVLGVVILTIPVVFVIVLSKLMAQRKQRPSGLRSSAGASHDPGGAAPAMAALGATHFATGGMDFSSDPVPPPQPTEGEPPPFKSEGVDHHRPPMEDAISAVPESASAASWWGDSSGAASGGGSFDSGSFGSGDSGGGGGGGSD